MMDDSMQIAEANICGELIETAKERKEFQIAEKALLLQKEATKINEHADFTEPYAVILHGDFWNNNFMCKYENESFLDFQLCRLASPVYDLSYFLLCCLLEEDVQNFDDIIKVYYKRFTSFLRELGNDPNKIFPLEELMNQWRKFAKFDPVYHKTLFAEAAEAGIDATLDAISYLVKNVEKYVRRTLPVMKLAIDRHFI
ncbi:EcKinase, DUF1679, and/or APH domain containing protein [Asbolus verrucosus]|uniref:EcKinase, DUF1679, and/or APH domain containing protein n=1 Tax=Asbolus verrucosus TaxID=1661398 RepID=A0A482WDK1_ASBVE|nr:EcKinase, DUF1679, and/or APH domain containing protein [Asbolus verrucosus]